MNKADTQIQMAATLRKIAIWLMAVVFLSTASLDAQTGRSDPQDQEDQADVVPDKKAQLEEKLRKMKANWQHFKNRMTTERNHFEYDELLRLEVAGIGESVLLDEDRDFEYFLDPSVASELKLSDELATRLSEHAKTVAKEWKTAIRSAYSQRDDMALQAYQDSVRVFDGRLQQDLLTRQLEQLQRIKYRSQVQRLGLPDSLMSDVIDIDATDGEKKSLALALQAEANKIRVEGNQLFAEQVMALFPGYLEDWQEQDAEKLPLLPLKLFLMLEKNPAVVMGSSKSRFQEYHLTLGSGYWVFPSPLMRVRRSGNPVLFSNNSKFHWLPKTPERSMHRLRRSEYNESESTEYRRLINEFLAQMNIQVDAEFKSTRKKLPTGLSPDAEEDFRMIQRIEINRDLDKVFREENLIPGRNYVRIHTLFSLGPDFVYKQLSQENRDRENDSEWPNEHEFRRELDSTVKTLARFVEVKESRLANMLVAQAQALDENCKLTPLHFDSPTSSQYELTLVPILEYGTPAAGRKRR